MAQTLFSDDFNRGTGIGANYTTVTSENALTISGNRLRGTTVSGNGNHMYVNTLGDWNGGSASITLASQTGTTNRSLGTTARVATGAETYYSGVLYKNGASITSEIASLVGGSFSSLATENATTWVANDVLRFDVFGASMILYRNDAKVLVTTGPGGGPTGGKFGATVYFDGTAADIEGDDFVITVPDAPSGYGFGESLGYSMW